MTLPNGNDYQIIPLAMTQPIPGFRIIPDPSELPPDAERYKPVDFTQDDRDRLHAMADDMAMIRKFLTEDFAAKLAGSPLARMFGLK